MSANTIPDDVMRAALLENALRDIAQMNPEEWGKQGIWRAHKVALAALAYAANLNPPSAASSRAEQTGEAQSLPASPVAQSDWITWNGGECPVDPETQVEWRGRDGYSNISAAGNLDWRHWQIRPRRIEPDLSSGDIIAYRVVPANLTHEEAQ